jgi:hypothetical protein
LWVAVLMYYSICTGIHVSTYPISNFTGYMKELTDMIGTKDIHSNMIEELLGETEPEMELFTRFTMEWFDMNIRSPRYHTEEEVRSAAEWAHKMVKVVKETMPKEKTIPDHIWIEESFEIETEIDGEITYMNEYRILVEPDSDDEKIITTVLGLD